MTPTHTKKPVNVRAFVFNGHIDCLDQDHVNAKLIQLKDYDSSNTICEKCDQHFDDHASIEIVQGAFTIVCPGDYVINNPQFPDDFYPCKPDVFNETYDDIKDEKEVTYSNESNDISQYDIRIIELKLRAAHLLLDNSCDHKDRYYSLDFIRQLIGAIHSEPDVVKSNGMSFGEIMALINENNEILVSRKAYDIDYIYFNPETDQFESYKNGVKTLHSFDTKDYTANDWHVVN